MGRIMDRKDALALLQKYNHEPFHILHALTVEGVMKWYANELGYGDEADYWGLVGLLSNIHKSIVRKLPNCWLKSGRRRNLYVPSAVTASVFV